LSFLRYYPGISIKNGGITIIGVNMLREVLFDTNFLMLPFQLKVNILAEVERLLDYKAKFIVLSSADRELEGLSKERGKDASAAKAALRWIRETREFELVESKGGCDEALLKRAAKTGAAIATMDKALRRRAMNAGVAVITLKGARRAIIESA
jgi:rRNA-processing protein FCF1